MPFRQIQIDPFEDRLVGISDRQAFDARGSAPGDRGIEKRSDIGAAFDQPTRLQCRLDPFCGIKIDGHRLRVQIVPMLHQDLAQFLEVELRRHLLRQRPDQFAAGHAAQRLQGVG